MTRVCPSDLSTLVGADLTPALTAVFSPHRKAGTQDRHAKHLASNRMLDEAGLQQATHRLQRGAV